MTTRTRLLLGLYDLALLLALPLVAMRELLRSRVGNTRPKQGFWRQKLGLTSPLAGLPTRTTTRSRIPAPIVIHAVSVGETVACAPLIEALLKAFPGTPLLVTHGTHTGADRARQLFGNRVGYAYLPWDLPGAPKRFLERLKPQLLVLLETELWPNLLGQARRQGVPVLLANGRISNRSLVGYRRLSSLTRHMLGCLDAIAAQDEQQLERFAELGAPRRILRVTGSLKFDASIAPAIGRQASALQAALNAGHNHPEPGSDPSRMIWIAASTHEGEEKMALAAHELVRQRFPTALLILAPRHPQRFDRVATLIKSHGLPVHRRSQQARLGTDDPVYLADTMGELALLYAVSQVAFVGGSLVPAGGHNLLEPVSVGTPIVTGPYTSNFSEVNALFANHGVLDIVNDADSLAAACSDLFADDNERARRSSAAMAILQARRGATERTLRLIKQCLAGKPGGTAAGASATGPDPR